MQQGQLGEGLCTGYMVRRVRECHTLCSGSMWQQETIPLLEKVIRESQKGLG